MNKFETAKKIWANTGHKIYAMEIIWNSRIAGTFGKQCRPSKNFRNPAHLIMILYI